MPASLSAARRSTALPSSNSAFSFSRLSDSPPGVRNRQEIRGTYLTAGKWNQSRLLQDSFDRPFDFIVKSQFETPILATSAEASSWLRKDPLEIPSDS